MALFTRSLWPTSVRVPYMRLVVALFVSPLLVTALLTLIAFVLSAISEQTTDAAIAATIDSVVTFGLLVAIFAASFGLPGVALLWSLSQRGMLAWMSTGLLFGAVAGSLFGALMGKGLALGPVVISTIAGVIFFALVRLIAGIYDDSRRD